MADNTEDLLGPQLLALSSSTRLYTVGLKTGPNLGYVNEIKIAKKEGEREEGGGEGRKSKNFFVGGKKIFPDMSSGLSPGSFGVPSFPPVKAVAARASRARLPASAGRRGAFSPLMHKGRWGGVNHNP